MMDAMLDAHDGLSFHDGLVPCWTRSMMDSFRDGRHVGRSGGSFQGALCTRYGRRLVPGDIAGGLVLRGHFAHDMVWATGTEHVMWSPPPTPTQALPAAPGQPDRAGDRAQTGAAKGRPHQGPHPQGTETGPAPRHRLVCCLRLRLRLRRCRCDLRRPRMRTAAAAPPGAGPGRLFLRDVGSIPAARTVASRSLRLEHVQARATPAASCARV